ncbi:AMP-binding protein [Variovorax sp. GB1P17]|uniref:AMP-binding protein n=1 Tax=Variovorax sp. GB1P17 TaxID=3443740 RepID=UPI003F489026
MRKDVSRWSTRLDDDMAARYRASGQWTGMTLARCAADRAAGMPGKIAVVDGKVQLTFAQLLDQATRLARTMRRAGLVPGDVVSFQLPNWHETLVINLACSLGGFVCNPIVPIYRDAEVGFILRSSRTRLLFVPDVFRKTDYVAMVQRLRADLPDLQQVVVLRPGRMVDATYDGWLSQGDGEGRPQDPPGEFVPVDPDAVKLLLYTSGTTGDPKGVLHSHNTIRSEIDAVMRFWAITPDDVVLMPSPVTHITGYLYALELVFAAGIKATLMERWDAGEAVDLIATNKASFSIGATPFLIELVAEVERRGACIPSLRLYGSGGAPVPPEVVRRARLALPNCLTFRVYGSSEAPTVSLGVKPGDRPELGATTDGAIVNHEVRIVDAVTGGPVAMGAEGEIVTRGPEVMLGYTNPAYTEEAFDADGFFHTGDLGFVDAHGYITVSGRKKDLIIRGGENISPKEIEDVLHRHPSVLEVAVVAMPHARMGETPCAYAVLRPGTALDLAGVIAFMDAEKVARQKIPERLVVLDELPHTATGKVLKHVLRARAGADAQDATQQPRI